MLSLRHPVAMPGWRPPPDLLRVGITAAATSARRTTPVPHLELNLAPTAEDMPEAIGLIRAIIAAADMDWDEMTVLLIHGEPAAVIAPYGHERRPGAAVEIRFDQTAPPEARLVLTDLWGGSIRMSTGEFRLLAREGISSRFEAMAQIAESWS
jgi:hypothetical protein